MIRKLLRYLGPIKSSFLITTVSILASVLIYIAIGMLTGQFLTSGLIISILIPALVVPFMSYYLLRILIKLDQTERNLAKLNDELEGQVNQRVLELENANKELQTEIAVHAQVEIELRDRTRQQTALREAIAAISSTLALEAVLSQIAEQMCRAINATSAYICDYDPETNEAKVLAEYIGPEACQEEQGSDLGEVYVEDGPEFLEKMYNGQIDTSLRGDPHLPQYEILHMEQHGAQAILYIPLRIKGRPIGYAELWESRRKREFLPEEIMLCQGIAQQAAITIENARLFEQAQLEITERKRAEALLTQRAAELATMLEVSRAVSSTNDLEEVLAIIAKQMVVALGVAGCTLSRWDKTANAVTTWLEWRRLDPKGGDEPGLTYDLDQFPATRTVLETRQPATVLVNDLGADQAEAVHMEAGGCNSLLMLPLGTPDEVIGLIELDDDHEREFTADQIRLGQALANQAGLAIKQAGLYAETRRQLKEQIALREAGRIISATLDLEAVLNHIAEQMGQALDVTSAYICGAEVEQGTFTVLAEYFGPEANAKERISDLGAIYSSQEFPGVFDFIEQDTPEVFFRDDPILTESERAHMEQYGAKTSLAIPLQTRGQLIGFAELWDSRQNRQFTADEISLGESIARQAGIAIENARLYRNAQQEIVERKRVEAKVKASLKEKEVLLQEIHHRVKNNLQVISSLLSLQSNYIEDRKVLGALDDSQHRVRSMALIHEKLYQSTDLSRIDFGDYVQDLVGYLFRAQGGYTRNIGLNIETDDIYLNIDTAVPCGLILNELISNSLKHAFPNGHSGDITVTCRADHDDQTTLTVSDNGVGFPPNLDLENTGSLGLELVQTLTEQLSGTLQLNNTQGTEFRVAFPTHHNKES